MRLSRFVSLISLAVFCVFGLVVVSAWATRHAIYGGQRFSVGVKKSVLTVAKFPTHAKSLIGLLDNYLPPKGVSNIYSNYLEVPSDSNRISGYLIVSCSSSNGANPVLLINLSNRVSKQIFISPKNRDVNQYSDYLIGSEPKRQSSFSSRYRVWHPYLSKEGMLTYSIPWNDLISVDLKTGQEKWRIRGAFHHSIEPNLDGDLWACGAVTPESISNPKLKQRQSNDIFEDQALVKISPSGKILQSISLADLILKSGLEYLLYGSSNPSVNFDPMHLNQITPILSDSGIFKKGQVLVSLRNISTIMLIDPDSQIVIWHGSGKWMNQHCVMPVGRSTFSVLDNHSFASGEYWLNPAWRTRILTYNIETIKSSEVCIDSQSSRNLYIPIEGRALPINSMNWMIEDSLQGTIMIFENQRLIFKWSNLYPDGTVGVTSWCRYVNSDALPDFIKD